MKIPEPTNSIANLIDASFEAEKQENRSHLGPSQMGNTCDRSIWYQFRWAYEPKFPGRTMRIFRRGQNEEPQVVSDLRRIGIDVRETGKNQRRVIFGGHVQGSIDGIIYGGVPEAPKKMHILEIKTHNKKSFDDILKNGIKPEHYIQMQMYMSITGIDRALYVAVCKDDDRYHFERVRLNPYEAEKAIERAKRISATESIPAPISTDPSWYQCKFCNAYEICHTTKKTKEVNCRTCANSTPKEDGTWYCEKWQSEIPVEAQRIGCEYHVAHPDLVPWRLVPDLSDEFVAAYDINGEIVKNGYGHRSSYLLLNVEPKTTEETVDQTACRVFDGEVVDFDELRRA